MDRSICGMLKLLIIRMRVALHAAIQPGRRNLSAGEARVP